MPITDPELLAAVEFKERATPKSVSVAQVNATQSQYRGTFIYKPADGQMTDARRTSLIKEVYGYTRFAVQGPGLSRVLPMRCPDPVFRSCYCATIDNIQGLGVATVEEVPEGVNDERTVPYYPKFNQYEFDITFLQRNYPVLTDINIQTDTDVWYDRNDQEVTYTYATEWWRYTEWYPEPQANFVQVEQGAYIFKTGTGGDYNPGNPVTGEAPNPNNAPFTSGPKMYLPDQLLKVVWYQVPYRYVASPNSYLEKYRGLVNQDTIYRWQGEIIRPGELLYVNYRLVSPPYTPVMPTEVTWPGGSDTSLEQFCDIELIFLRTRRPGTDLPSQSQVSNRNYVVANHNLMPWIYDRTFRYVQSAQSLDLPVGTPAWLSFPVALLWTDPDFTQPQPQP